MLNLNFQNGQAPALNARNMNAIVEAINTMQTKLANPFKFKGSCLFADLPSTGNTINDTWYVTDRTCLYSWDGDSWEESSLKESDYLEILQQLTNNIDAMRGIESFTWVDDKVILSDGSIATNLNYSYTSNFIPVSPNSKIIVYTRLNGDAAIVVYRSDKTTIDASYTKTSESGGILYQYDIELSGNAAYVRFSCGKDDKGSAFITKEKENKLTFDKIPTKNSANPVTSNGIFEVANTLGLFYGGVPITEYEVGKGFNVIGTTVDVNNPSTVAGVTCVCVPCSAGDTFTYIGNGSATYRHYAFVDNNGVILERGLRGSINNLVVSAPENSVYAVFNFLNTSRQGLVKGMLAPENLTEIKGFLSGYGFNTTGETVDLLNPIANNAVGCSFVQCEAGDKFTLYTNASNSYRMWCFLDKNKRIIDKATNEGTVRNRIITAPANAKYVVFNWIDAQDHHIYYGYDKEYSRFNFYGANVAIIGDSISTNGDYSANNPLGNVPEIVVQSADVGVPLSAYVTYYDIGTTIGGHTITANDVGTELHFTPSPTDVGKMVGKPNNNNDTIVNTWWEFVRGELGFNPIPVCWSGSSITSHQKDVNEYKTSYSWHEAQIRKCGIRTPGTMDRTAPDVIIIFRGGNDMTHTPYTRITDILDRDNVTIPETDVISIDGYTQYGYIEGYMVLINKLLTAYPNARIVICTQNYLSRLSGGIRKFPTSNGINTLQNYNDATRKIADFFGLPVIEFDKDGLNFWNASNVYYQDSAPNYTHPTTAGHLIMGNKALLDLTTKVNSFN